jgi:hypothetical protein
MGLKRPTFGGEISQPIQGRQELIQALSLFGLDSRNGQTGLTCDLFMGPQSFFIEEGDEQTTARLLDERQRLPNQPLSFYPLNLPVREPPIFIEVERRRLKPILTDGEAVWPSPDTMALSECDDPQPGTQS